MIQKIQGGLVLSKIINILTNANYESKKTANNLHKLLTKYGYEPFNGFKKMLSFLFVLEATVPL